MTRVGTAPGMSVLCAANAGRGAEPGFWAFIAVLLPFKGESVTGAEPPDPKSRGNPASSKQAVPGSSRHEALR